MTISTDFIVPLQTSTKLTLGRAVLVPAKFKGLIDLALMTRKLLVTIFTSYDDSGHCGMIPRQRPMSSGPVDNCRAVGSRTR